MDDLLRRFGEAGTQGLLLELALLAACVALAWGITRWFGRDQPKDPIWFGQKTFDGLLFRWRCCWTDLGAASYVLDHQRAVVLRIAVPVFLSLAAIRLSRGSWRPPFPRRAWRG